jgi:hypothetical protein
MSRVCRRVFRAQAPAGYALPLVLVILLVAFMAYGLVIFVLTASIAETKRVQGQIRAFYACDSAVRLSSRIAENVVLANPRLTSSQVTTLSLDAICAAAGGCQGTRSDQVVPPFQGYVSVNPGESRGPTGLMPPGNVMENFSIAVRPISNTRYIQFGAFRDMQGSQANVNIGCKAANAKTGSVGEARDSFSLASLYPSQFMAFSTTPIAWQAYQLRKGPDASPSLPRLGPSIYADGNLSIGSNVELVRAVTTGTFTATAGRVWNGDVLTPLYIAFSGDNGLWARSINNRLTLLARPGRVQGQLPGEKDRNARWLLDPPTFVGGGDNGAAREAKLAMQADIRVINGVWFIKPPPGSSEPRWPGIPIWSDRMGKNVRPATPEERALMEPPGNPEILIGQLDIMERHGITNRWPQRYSYYESGPSGQYLEGHQYDDVTGVPEYIFPTHFRAPVPPPAPAAHRTRVEPANNYTSRVYTGVVSYGVLSIRDGVLVPGARHYFNCSTKPPATFDDARLMPFDDCGVEWDALVPHNNVMFGLLEGSRMGFRDPNLEFAGAPHKEQADQLPMNFDMKAFLAALNDGRKGELGSYFCGAQVDVNEPLDLPPVCRQFNGVVYITNTWHGSLNGLINDIDGWNQRKWPVQGRTAAGANVPGAFLPGVPVGRVNTSVSPPAPPPIRQPGIPLHLCVGDGDGGGSLGGLTIATTPIVNVPFLDLSFFFDLTGGLPTVFQALRCGSAQFVERYDVPPTQDAPAVTAVRIFNARDLSALNSSPVPRRLTNKTGLTIASNLPVYLYGDWNAIPGAPREPGEPVHDCTIDPTVNGCTFPTTAVAGDTTTFISNPGQCTTGYNDTCAAWHDPLGGKTIVSASTTGTNRDTLFVGSFMSSTSAMGGIQNIEDNFRRIQHWAASGKMIVIGSQFNMGRAVYHPTPQAKSYYLAAAPNIDWSYNPALSGLRQPPSMPRFLVGVTSRWRDLREGSPAPGSLAPPEPPPP